MVGDVPGSVLGMLSDLTSKLQHGVLTPDQLERFLKKQNPFLDEGDSLATWARFYFDVFGVEKDFSGLVIPKRKRGFDRLLVMAEGMTPNRLFDKIKELMPAWRYQDDLDIIVSDRKADHDYAVWIRDRVEADEELKNLSANDLKERDVADITFPERLLHEIVFFKETGNHLDVHNWTLCAGSRHPYGHVPCVYWSDDGLGVSWTDPDDSDVYLRSRAAVL